MIILLYGQPASGKTTLADKLVPFFSSNCIRIDGDVWRDITKNKDYSKEGRIRNLKNAFDMAIFLESKGFVPLLSFVTPYEELRSYLKDNCNLIEIYLHYDSQVDRGRNNYFAIDFEVPKTDCLKIDTSENSIDECLHEIKKYINQKKDYELE